MQQRARAPAPPLAPSRRSTRVRTQVNYAERFGGDDDEWAFRRRESKAGPHSVPVHPYTLAASSSLAWPLVPSLLAHVYYLIT